ncbi:uncharacterized protein LOC121406310 [Lytechinus variegatus]|uniref:uncharacterized protein LOC121406310 n=1 Tax=Lytechinus variegatus TaxID=7654 RepID=UPI001BB229C1|nr:uncharacterized protein LOC121406310 [Lytechinus variegatus]
MRYRVTVTVSSAIQHVHDVQAVEINHINENGVLSSCLVWPKGYSVQPCPSLNWNHTFLAKAYYIVQEQLRYTDQVNDICGPLGTELLVIDSLEENDFIVEKLKAYEPSGESKVFLGCPGHQPTPPRNFSCRGSDATYQESTSASMGFWNWRGGKPEAVPGKCIRLNTEDDGAWVVSGCGPLSNFVICQCQRGIPSGTLVSTRFNQITFGSKNCLQGDRIMRVVSVHSFIECVMECQSDVSCSSFNLIGQNGITTHLCQLSVYHSSIVDLANFIVDETCKYYELMR